MRLLKLTLENWRGIERREVQFSGGVTLIEGPNEIGKSTIVEALRMLFREMDSSNKRAVKSIQPVGEDVGSSIEAEVQSGPYRFVYRKTFNKGKETTLHVLAPSIKQFTGREAHEEAERILEETMDMALWDALLVDQGEKVALANLQHSSGLARALDNAAGAGSGVKDDSGLFETLQTEYEQYFTLRSGKERFADSVTAHDRASAALDAARLALQKVEDDAEAHQQCLQEMERRTNDLHGLKEKVDTHEKSWSTIQRIKEELKAKERALEVTKGVQKNALDARQRRNELADEIRRGRDACDQAKRLQEPLRERAAALKEQVENYNRAVTDLRKAVQVARDILDVARRDQQHCYDIETLATQKNRHEQLEGISKRLKSTLQIVSSTKIDDTVLEEMRNLGIRESVASAKRDAAATTISVTAEKALELEVDGDGVSLAARARHTKSVASEIQLRIPGVAMVTVAPSQSAAELQQDVDAAKESLDKLYRRFAVENFDDAVVANQRRADAQKEVDRLKAREEDVLKGERREEIEDAIASLQAGCDGYLAARNSDRELPADSAAAARTATALQDELAEKERTLDSAREKTASLQAQFEDADRELRAAEQELAGLTAALADREGRLGKERKAESDEVLAERVRDTTLAVQNQEREAGDLAAGLADAAPDSVEALLTNAQAVHRRASSELGELETQLAVLGDRLAQAQADGRSESLERAEQAFKRTESELAGVRRRAAAAKLLWTTLNKHRNAARQVYVKPLKDAIERLGAIVFGGGFEVDVGEDWSLVARTFKDKTLPFEDLSVGAREQLGILMRLAAAQIVSKQGGVPLIIDDALGFSDPSRLETMGAAIAAAGKECQVIILTCTPGRFTHVGNAEVVRFDP